MNVELVLGRPEAAGETDAGFALLVERQSRFVFRIAYVVLRNVEDAEDVVQDAFLKLFRSGAWKRMEDEKSYLARVAWRLAIRKAQGRNLGADVEPSDVACSEISPELAAIETERRRTIHCLIDALPEKLRRPLALSSMEEMTTPEIAVVMSLPEGTVRRLLMEGRALVKEKLARMEGSNRG